MLEAWLIYDREQANRNKALIALFNEIGKQYDVAFKLLIREDLSVAIVESGIKICERNHKLENPDFCVYRSWDIYLHRIVEQLHVPVFNSSKLSEVANDKAETYSFASSIGLPVMRTFVVGRDCTPNLQYPFVVKPRCGHGEQGVELVSNPDEYDKITKTYDEDTWIVQECAGDVGKDCRVYVIGNKPVIAMTRQSGGDFRSNLFGRDGI